MSKKFKRHKFSQKIEYENGLPFVPHVKKVTKKKMHTKEFYLSQEDRLQYVYETEEKSNYTTNIVGVLYDTFIENKWITILRYDSEHGYLHRHMKVNLSDKIPDVISTIGVRRKGDPSNWLTWAIENTKDNYLNYKRGFIRRCLIDKKK